MTSNREIIAVGDIHGELDGLLEILRRAELVDGKWRWCGGDRVLVQTGDVIDRGPRSREAYDLLADLQSQAPKSGGEVVRLLGNHELMVLERNYRHTNVSDVPGFRARLEADVLSGRVKGAHVSRGFLFSHAGVQSRMREMLLGTTTGPSSVGIADRLADKLNEALLEAVRTDTYTHPCFFSSPSRGGSATIGGPYWTGGEGLERSAGADVVRQVVGHTKQPRIRWNLQGRIFFIDVAIHEGGRGYLRVADGDVEPVCWKRGSRT